MFGGIPPTVKSGIYSGAFSLVALTSVVALGLALPSTSSAQAATSLGPMEMPFFGTNPCTGELLEGTARVTMIAYPPRNDGAGGMHMTIRMLSHAQATSLGPDPKKHQANDELVESLNLPSSGTIESTSTVNLVLVRQGEAQSSLIPLSGEDDFLFKLTFHVTTNSNGLITALVNHHHQNECAGPPLGPAAITVP